MNRIEFVLVLLFTFFVIVVWITSDVILAKPQTAEDPKVQKLPSMLEPLSPNFDSKTIELINGQKLQQPATVAAPTPPPAIATPAPSASSRAIPTPTTSPKPSPTVQPSP